MARLIATNGTLVYNVIDYGSDLVVWVSGRDDNKRGEYINYGMDRGYVKRHSFHDPDGVLIKKRDLGMHVDEPYTKESRMFLTLRGADKQLSEEFVVPLLVKWYKKPRYPNLADSIKRETIHALCDHLEFTRPELPE